MAADATRAASTSAAPKASPSATTRAGGAAARAPIAATSPRGSPPGTVTAVAPAEVAVARAGPPGSALTSRTVPCTGSGASTGGRDPTFEVTSTSPSTAAASRAVAPIARACVVPSRVSSAPSGPSTVASPLVVSSGTCRAVARRTAVGTAPASAASTSTTTGADANSAWLADSAAVAGSVAGSTTVPASAATRTGRARGGPVGAGVRGRRRRRRAALRPARRRRLARQGRETGCRPPRRRGRRQPSRSRGGGAPVHPDPVRPAGSNRQIGFRDRAGAPVLCPPDRSRAVPAPVAQRIEHLTTDQEVGGSSPSGRAR